MMLKEMPDLIETTDHGETGLQGIAIKTEMERQTHLRQGVSKPPLSPVSKGIEKTRRDVAAEDAAALQGKGMRLARMEGGIMLPVILHQALLSLLKSKRISI